MPRAGSAYAVPPHGGDPLAEPADPPVPFHRRLARLVPEAVVGSAAVAVLGYGLDGATPWRDELVTLVVADRPVGDIRALARTQDLVHLGYYLLVHPLLGTAHGIIALRWLSVAAVALTAVVLVRIGRRLAGPAVGLAAGAAFVAAPTASRYAQEARSFSLVAALVALSTLQLLRASDATVRRRPATLQWAGYAALVVLTGLGNVLGLLAVLGHAGYVLTMPARRRGAVRRRWLRAGFAAALPLAPFLLASSRQTQQVAWLQRPGTEQLLGMATLVWSPAWAAVAAVVVAVVAVGVRGTRGARSTLALGLGWGLLPPLVLWAVAQRQPLYHEHYLFPDAAGLALAVGSLAGLRPPATAGGRSRVALAAALVVVPVGVLAVAGLPVQRAHRAPTGHGEDVPGVAAVIDARGRAGDAVVYLPYWLRLIAMAYPLPPGVDEVALGKGPLETATITGDVVAPDVALQRLAGRCRVWVVTQTWSFSGYGPTDEALVTLVRSRYEQVGKDAKQAFDVYLFRLREPRCATS